VILSNYSNILLETDHLILTRK